MKRLIMALVAILLMAPVYCEAKSQLEKARDKELKTKLKEYKKDNWKVLGSRTMEVSLASHYDKLNSLGDDGKEFEGTARAKSINNAKQMALNNAVITYAQMAGSSLKGRVVSDMNANGVDPDAEFDNFYAAYERLVEKEIRNEMEPSFSVIHDNPDGTHDVRSYFIINESSAARARQRAAEEALKGTQAAQKLGEKISDFVHEGFGD